MAKILGSLSLAVFVLSAIVHGLTFVPGCPVTMNWTVPLHVAAIGACAAMAISAASLLRRLKAQGSTGFALDPIRCVPRPLVVLCLVIAVYTGINFVLFVWLMEGGNPVADHGRFFLSDHGSTIRVLDAAEYRRFQAYEVRGFSGHWLLLSIIPTLYFFYVQPAIRKGVQGR
jgi:hypothetical protein